jgi:hypothetical protein
MIKFLIGSIFGFMLATVGVSGVAKIIDQGVSKAQTITKNTIDNVSLDTKVDEAKAAVKKAAE